MEFTLKPSTKHRLDRRFDCPMDTVLVLTAFASAFCFALALVLAQFGLCTTMLPRAQLSLTNHSIIFSNYFTSYNSWDQWAVSSATIFAAVGLFFRSLSRCYSLRTGASVQTYRDAWKPDAPVCSLVSHLFMTTPKAIQAWHCSHLRRRSFLSRQDNDNSRPVIWVLFAA